VYSNVFCSVDEAVVIEGEPQRDIATTISTTTTNDDDTIQHSEDVIMESDVVTMEHMYNDDCITTATENVVTSTNHVQYNFVTNSISTLSG